MGIVAIPLAASPALGFVAVKWHALELLAVAGVLLAACASRTPPLPGFVRGHARPLAALAALTVFNTLRAGFAEAVEPLLARLTFAALAACAYVYFSGHPARTSVVRAALAASSAVVIAMGLAQALGLTRGMGAEPLFGIAGGDGRSGTFGNVNMAAQFVGFALTFLIASRATDASSTWRRALPQDALVAAGLAYMYLVGARSAMLALAAGGAVAAACRGRRGVRAVLRPLLLAGVIAAALATVAFWRGGHVPLLGGAQHPLKSESLRIRQRLWRATVELIRDHPLGAGSGNFLDAFLPYQLADERLRSETLVYTTPHSEILRGLAEEGVVWCVLAGYLLLRLAIAVAGRGRDERWPPTAAALAAGGAFLAVEGTFQFPFAMAFGCLMAAMLLGLAWSFLETEPPAGPSLVPWPATGRLALVIAALLAGFAVVRLVRSDALVRAGTPGGARPREACALNPRHRRACLTAAWLDARAGERVAARGAIARILDRSPYYYPAIKLLADESFARGDARSGCFHLWVYDALFAGRSSEHERLSALCSADLQQGFRAAVAVPGYDRYPLTVPGDALR